MEELWTQAESFFNEYGVISAIFVFFSLLLGIAVYNDETVKRRRLMRRRGKEMEDARQAYIRERLADHITNCLEDDLWEGLMTRKEVNSLYSSIGKSMGIRDLVPRNGKLSYELLKKQIKLRLSRNDIYILGEHPENLVIFPDCPGWVIRFQCNHH